MHSTIPYVLNQWIKSNILISFEAGFGPPYIAYCNMKGAIFKI